MRTPDAAQRFFSGALKSRGPDFTDGDPGSRLCVASFHAAPQSRDTRPPSERSAYNPVDASMRNCASATIGSLFRAPSS